MQIREIQVRRSLDALREGDADPDHSSLTTDLAAEQPVGHDPADVPDGLLDDLAVTPSIRPEALARARERLESGHQPSSTAVASLLVGRMVCDRLR